MQGGWSEQRGSRVPSGPPQPRRAAWMVALSIFSVGIIASRSKISDSNNSL